MKLDLNQTAFNRVKAFMKRGVRASNRYGYGRADEGLLVTNGTWAFDMSGLSEIQRMQLHAELIQSAGQEIDHGIEKLTELLERQALGGHPENNLIPYVVTDMRFARNNSDVLYSVLVPENPDERSVSRPAILLLTEVLEAVGRMSVHITLRAHPRGIRSPVVIDTPFGRLGYISPGIGDAYKGECIGIEEASLIHKLSAALQKGGMSS